MRINSYLVLILTESEIPMQVLATVPCLTRDDASTLNTRIFQNYVESDDPSSNIDLRSCVRCSKDCGFYVEVAVGLGEGEMLSFDELDFVYNCVRLACRSF